jgi:6,7-dimethyl-8-ribityllumazine synthase
MSEFDAIEGVDGWRRKLEALLREAEQAARDEERRFEIAARLREFVRNSGPQVPDIARLDDIASATVRALMNQTIDARLAELADRSVELARLAKAIDAVAVDAAAAGDSIRLVRTRAVIDSLTRSVEAVTALRAIIDGQTDRDLAAQVEAGLAALQELRSTVEGVSVSRPRRAPAPRARAPKRPAKKRARGR